MPGEERFPSGGTVRKSIERTHQNYVLPTSDFVRQERPRSCRSRCSSGTTVADRQGRLASVPTNFPPIRTKYQVRAVVDRCVVAGPCRRQKDSSMTAETLNGYSTKVLAEMAKNRGVQGWHSMRKDQLVKSLLKLVRQKSNKTKAKRPARRRLPQRATATSCKRHGARTALRSKRRRRQGDRPQADRRREARRLRRSRGAGEARHGRSRSWPPSPSFRRSRKIRSSKSDSSNSATPRP